MLCSVCVAVGLSLGQRNPPVGTPSKSLLLHPSSRYQERVTWSLKLSAQASTVNTISRSKQRNGPAGPKQSLAVHGSVLVFIVAYSKQPGCEGWRHEGALLIQPWQRQDMLITQGRGELPRSEGTGHCSHLLLNQQPWAHSTQHGGGGRATTLLSLLVRWSWIGFCLPVLY